MDNNLSNFLWATVCVGQLALVIIACTVAAHLARIVERLGGLMLAVQELCDRIWELRDIQ